MTAETSQTLDRGLRVLKLLADTDHEVADAYGVWGEKSYAGKTYMGVHRSTFVIDADGTVARIFPDVKPAEHADQVLEALSR